MHWLLEKAFDTLLAPPEIPVKIPVPMRVLPHIKKTIYEAIKIAYFQGLSKGFVAGALLASVVIFALQRSRPR